MSFFNPYIPIKSVERSHHPWEKRIKAKYSNAYKHGHNSVNNPICPASKTDKKSESQEESNKNEHIKFTVIGNRVTKEFIYCMYLVKGLHKCRQKQFEAPVIRGLTGIEWPKVWNDLKLKFGSPAYCLRSQVAVLKNDELLGGESELKEFVETRYVYNLYLDYYIEGVKQFANFVKSSGRPCVYMHISIDSQPVGSLIFMLYADIAPLTCQNFMKMCQLSRGGYAGSPIHRIVQDCWIQCGGFLLKSPDILTCENYIVPHDKRGVLGMVNNGRHEDCSTQFFVLLQPAPWMNDRFVAFGQLIDGDKTLEKIESVTTWYESPTSDIIIDRAGILNLECQRMPINKRTNEYIEGHIEDLVLIGHLFYEALLDKVFIEIEIKNLQRFENQLRENAEEVITIKSFRKTERYVGTKEEKQDNLLTPVTGQSTENNDFDVDEYEYEDVYDDKPFTPVASSVVTPSKFYYLPLTDVPYPDEVDSIYDLKRFLRGDYCLESDLKKDLNKPEDEPFNLNVPKHVIETLFDYLTINVDLSDSSLSEEDETIVKTYLRENKDSTSFAGRIVTKMANLSQKLSLFDDTLDEKTNKNIILADEDLRLIRVAQKEMASIRKRLVQYRNVSMSSDTHFPHGVIRRRPTGFVRPEDLVRFVQEVDEDDDDNNDNEILVPRTDSSRFFITGLSQMKKQSEDTGAIYSKGYLKKHDDLKKVTIASSPNLLPISNHVGKLRSNLGLTEETNEVRRTSVLQRLFMELDANSDDDEAPTLKNYKPMAESNKKHFLLTNSHYEIHYDDERLKHVNQVVDGDNSIDRILQLQHGKRFSRKISSDYVKTIDQLENMEKPSIRSVEYSKRRPSMTIAKYQEKNREYYENLVTTQDKMTTTETRSQRGKTRKTKK